MSESWGILSQDGKMDIKLKAPFLTEDEKSEEFESHGTDGIIPFEYEIVTINGEKKQEGELK